MRREANLFEYGRVKWTLQAPLLAAYVRIVRRETLDGTRCQWEQSFATSGRSVAQKTLEPVDQFRIVIQAI